MKECFSLWGVPMPGHQWAVSSLFEPRWQSRGTAKVREYHMLTICSDAKYMSLWCQQGLHEASLEKVGNKSWQWLTALRLCEWKDGEFSKGVSIPDHNLACGEKASRCGCWLFSRFQFRSGRWFSPQCKVRGIESGSSRILLSKRGKPVKTGCY